ncbi:Pre-mRNA-splicing factor ATP-dependent RNA helicase DEAH1 [Turnera subulata]|uniref:RNA helicase n=1 Tax=Turnera subulata TaxID=218843 RepID=A0A9Q0G2M1_9ROSI|nr:Pre-mRNA-splicing factor ATP-dependent RNA helicase DEAH1 [Turnera subulata]
METHKKLFRRRRDESHEEEDDEAAIMRRVKRQRTISATVPESEEERPPSRAMPIEKLRTLSRQQYLKRREEKKLQELKEEVEDEHYLFQGVNLTETECRRWRYKDRVYQLSKKKKSDDGSSEEYRIPEAYDDEGAVHQKERFGVALKRYRGASDLEQTWEESQIERARFSYGSKNKKQASDKDYPLVFENQIAFIKASVMDGDEFDDKKSHDETTTAAAAKATAALDDKLQEERKTLPIYQYRDAFLQAVKDHQVLIIVGETGSGKTTQIPQYLHEAGYTKRGKIGCTQPRRVAAMSVAARVAKEMGVRLGHEVGYAIRFEDCTSSNTVLKYMTDGLLLKEFGDQPDLAEYTVLVLDEAHERSLPTDMLFALVKDLARSRPDLKVLISSATLDAEKFSDFFDSAPVFKIPGRRFPVEINHTLAPEADYLDAAIVTALQIHTKEPPGDILMFLTGQEEIETAEQILKQRTRGFGTKIAELIICPIYAGLPTELQAKIFEPTPQGARKVVLATNIAETSVTIDGIKYVIDPGFCKKKSYNPKTRMDSLQVAPISKASANQRAGRSGRTGPGKCFRLYTASNYQDLEDNNVPEIQRTNLSNVVLILKSMGIDDLINFEFMDQPPPEALLQALELLYALSALNKNGLLTKVGKKMVGFPLDPMLSKMVVASDKYKCSEEIITIAAMLSVGNAIFYCPKDKRVHAQNAKISFHVGDVGDHIALLRVYNSWKENNFSRQWCYENYIQVRSMKTARDIRDQLEGLLEKAGIELTSNPNDVDAIKKCITSGFFPNIARLDKYGSYRTLKHPHTVHLHPGSGLAEVLPRWVVYHELVLTAKEYMRQVTEVKPAWLVEIAPHYYQMKDVDDPALKKMPRGVGRIGKELVCF